MFVDSAERMVLPNGIWCLVKLGLAHFVNQFVNHPSLMYLNCSLVFIYITILQTLFLVNELGKGLYR